ncbi:Ribose ABC transport system, ATP-binding protein RbsA (TC 3.A.1.2.1) [hydrothermal vent metagenome]|uniref:Ribose ABC transport system, ATP-binding protein RbsA (TC 3.A.1.2.1) n=1 Tax=hydrothermal vent metagenome TaxID=652676 RepID=A0A3B1DJ03_9ZZZZ
MIGFSGDSSPQTQPSSRDAATPLLICEHISKRFGVTQALDDVSAAFLPGEIHAIMGENGAGKSTLGKVIAGLHKQDTGLVTINGQPLTPGSIEEAFAAGIRIVHQELAQCPNLSVAENLCLHDIPRSRLGLVDRSAMQARAARLLATLEPGIDVEAPLGNLAPGRRQIVQIASSLDEGHAAEGGEETAKQTARQTAKQAKLIVLDEPTSSLSIAEVDRLMQIARQLAAGGLTLLYVSHRMAEIFQLCDRVTVLRDGKFVATNVVSEIDEHTLIEQMIGRRLTHAEKRKAPETTEGSRPALRVRQLSSPGKLDGVSLDVAPGEIVGIGGLVGSGRSELFDAIFGIDRRAHGQVAVEGREIGTGSERAMIRAGVGYVPEDRKLQGLFFDLGIDENLLMPIMPGLATAGVRRLGAERTAVAERVAEFQIKAASPKSPPGSLSGGNQQKLLIARWMTHDTRVLLLDEPTRGIDVGTKAEVYRLVREAAERGVAVLVISSEMPELLAMSDRILVMCEGRIAGELRGKEMTQAHILKLATLESR